jgi:exonuclease SbcD
MDFGEKDDEKSIVLVEIGPKGRRGEPRVVPVEPTPLVDLRISDPYADRDTIANLVPNAREALVRVEVSPSAAVEAGDALERAIHEALPNVTLVERRRPEPIESPSARVVIPQSDLRATVLDYLRRQLREDDPQRDDLLALAAQFVDRGDQQ